MDFEATNASDTETLMSAIESPFYDDNNEWAFVSYSYQQGTVVDLVAQKEYSTLQITLTCRRNDGFYTITLFVPVALLTLLSPIGLILPTNTGEKMGLQVRT